MTVLAVDFVDPEASTPTDASPAPAAPMTDASGACDGPIHIGRSGVHGMGAFAARDMADGERLGVYRGRRYSARQAMRRGWNPALTYLFGLTDGSFIDGSCGGDATRHLNHSCAPNCIAYEEPDARGRITVVFYALRAIQAGEELFLDYTLEGDPTEAAAFACACGAAVCRGTMLAPT